MQIPEEAEAIDSVNPTFVLFLVDQSGSMAQPFEGRPNQTMAEGVATAINGIIRSLVLRSSDGSNIKEYYYLGMIGYNNEINIGFGGALSGKYQVSIKEIAENPLRIEDRVKKEDDGVGGILTKKVKFPIWIDPVAQHKTRMCEALKLAKQSVADFVESFPESFPPIVINITDGLPTDATKPDFPEAEQAANEIRAVTNANGNAVSLFNIHISQRKADPVLYPLDESQLPDRYSKILFRMSSPLTDRMVYLSNVMEMDFELEQGCRGFVYQGDLVSVIQLLDIGTRTA